jgi:hypothetical protein
MAEYQSAHAVCDAVATVAVGADLFALAPRTNYSVSAPGVSFVVHESRSGGANDEC